MTTTDQSIEQEIQAKGKTAPRVTPADLQANIVSAFYFNANRAAAAESAADPQGAWEMLDRTYNAAAAVESLSLLTFCVLVLRNGFTVSGESACASPENFDAELSRKIARQNAEQKVWPLMGYALKDRLATAA